MMRAMCAQLAGDTDEAKARAKEAFRIGSDGGQPDAAVIYRALLGALNIQRGTTGEQIPMLDQMAAELPGLTDAITSARAATYAYVSRLNDAHRLLEQFAAAGFNPPPIPWDWLPIMINYAEVCVACRDTNIAAPLFDRLEPFAEQVPTNILSAWDPVSHYLGGLATVLCLYDQADNYYARATEFNRRAGAKFFAANTNLGWGKMFVERGDPGDRERARDLIAAAHVAAVTHGYADIERRAAEALENLSRD
jgi:tetratricopeptide (TPR) repeat protein